MASEAQIEEAVERAMEEVSKVIDDTTTFSLAESLEVAEGIMGELNTRINIFRQELRDNG